MISIKQLTSEDYQFQYGDTVIDATQVLVLWGETPTSVPLLARYENLARSLSTACATTFEVKDAYIIMEQSVKMVGELKKRLSS